MTDARSSSETRLRGLALNLRSAIQAIARSDLPSLEEFPLGACGDASILLGEYLFENGAGEWQYVTGTRADGHTHAWVERGDVIIDVTADQFGDGQPPVLITNDGRWHRQFRQRDHHPALIGIYDSHTQASLRRMYQRVLKHLARSEST